MSRFFNALLLAPAIALTAGAAVRAEAPRSLNDLTGPWQLFVDDALVSEKANVVRTYHPFEKHADNPLIRADKPWEGANIYLYGTVLPNEFGPGLRMWYHALPGDHDFYRLLYATSEDGLTWDKPELGIVEHQGSTANNIFIRRGRRDHIPSIIHTPWETDPQRQYLMINFCGEAHGYMAAWSPDGLHWTDAADEPVFTRGGDVGQFLRDFHTGEYAGYVKNIASVSGLRRRAVGRIATGDPVDWPGPRLVLVPDTFDDRWAEGVQRTSFYGMSVFPYETMYLGFLWVFQATDHTEGYFDGPIFIELVTSRDGVNWLRQEGDRTPILPIGPDGAWDAGMVFTPQHPLVVGDELWLYYGGIDDHHGARNWNSAIGLATLRKDGFVSLDAAGEAGTVVTKRLAGVSGPLRINYRAGDGGAVRVELLNPRGNPLPGFTLDDCIPLTGDSTDAVVTWQQRRELPRGNTPVSLRFMLENASLYSFSAGQDVRVLDDLPELPLAVLLTFEDGWRDVLRADGEQRILLHGRPRIIGESENVAFGSHAARLGSEFAPLQTLEISGTTDLGTQFTLALMARSQDNRHARLFSSYDDHGPIRSTELVFDYEPAGRCLRGLRLICKGITVESSPITVEEGKYHHLAVTYNQGNVMFYLDGREMGSGLIPGGEPVKMLRNLRVGEDSQHGHEQQFRGHVDDILVLGRALDAVQIGQIASQGAEAFFRANPQAGELRTEN